MRNIRLEKAVKKIDKDIEALKIVSKYLSNTDEINEVKESLNQKRQELANELYAEDSIAYNECRGRIKELLGESLDQEAQKSLLEDIKESFGRQSPNPSKDGVGLNAWLKEIDIEFEWINNDNSEWATLVLNSFGLHKKYK